MTDSELDSAFSGLELAQRNLVTDLSYVGITSGVGVVEHSPTPDLTVDVAAGTAYDQSGQRMRVPSLQVVNLAVDSSAVSTSVVNPGQSKIVGLFLKFKRAESDPRTDGDGNPVNFIQDEGFEFRIVQGAEAVSPTAPALLADALLLADITRTFGQTQIVSANISTARRQLTIQLTAGAVSVNVGTFEEAMQALLTELNNHVTGAANKHPATAIDYSSGPTWLGGRTNPATTVKLQLNKIVDDLSAQTASDDGAERIGSEGRAGIDYNLTVGSVASQLQEIINKVVHGVKHTFPGIALDGVESSGSLAADQHNYPLGANVHMLVLLPGAAGIDLTGIVAPASEGTRVAIHNSSAVDSLTLKHDNAGSTTTNRFTCPNAADVVIPPKGTRELWYSVDLGANSRWFVLG